MQSYHVIQNMQYLSCPKNNHFQQEISMVCLQANCQQHLLVCPICEAQYHQGHNVTELKKFILETLNCDGIPKVILPQFQEMESLKVSAINQIQSLKQDFLQGIYELQQRIQSYFNQVQAQFIQVSAFSNNQHIIKIIDKISRSKSLEHLQSFLSTLRIYGKTSLTQTLNCYVTSTQGKIKKFMKQMDDLKILCTFQKLKDNFEMIKEPTLTSKYIWSSDKAKKIQIDGLVATQTTSGSNGQRFALMENADKINADIVVGVKVRKLKGWIGVGICLHDLIVNSGFKFNYTQHFHGSYLISTNGYSWSHSQLAFNSTQKSFIFGQGDVIKICYNASKKQVRFECPNKAASFAMQVSIPPLHDYYVPCVNMCNPGDEVQIVNDIN